MEIYNTTRVRLLKAAINWDTINLVAIAWAGDPDFNPEDDEVQDITVRGRVTKLGESLAINHTSVAPDGSAQTDQVLIPGIPVGQLVTWITLCERSANPDLHKLLIAVNDAVGMPFDPNGLDIIVNPDWLSARGWYRP